MNPVHAYLAGLAVTLAVSGGVVVYLQRHLVRILTDLCGTEPRASFWTAFSNVTLVLGPLLCALHRRPPDGAEAYWVLTSQLEWALMGLILSVLALGVVISLFILCTPREERAPISRAAGRTAPRAAPPSAPASD